MRNKVLGVLAVGTAVLLGCAESDYSNQGSGASSETESRTSVSNTDPGVAAESGTVAAADVATNATGASQNESTAAPPSTQNEQGTQASPEPKTGDDANPDSVQPDL